MKQSDSEIMLTGGVKTRPSLRDKQIDGLKFILIFLVVLGHIRQPDYSAIWTKWIYSFHMPAFIFISGYFSSPDTSWAKLWKWLKRIALIYIIVQITHNLIYVAAGWELGRAGWLGIFPQFGLWYLMSLAYWRFALKIVANRVSDTCLLITSFVLSLLVGFIPIDQYLSFQRTFTFLPFFVLGYYFKRHNLVAALERTPYWISAVLFALAIFVSTYLPNYVPHHHYDSYSDMPILLAQMSLAVVLCVALFRLSRVKLIEPLARFGKYTLWVYIGHSYFILTQSAILQHYGFKFDLWNGILMSALYVAIATSLAIFYEKLSHPTDIATVSSN